MLTIPNCKKRWGTVFLFALLLSTGLHANQATSLIKAAGLVDISEAVPSIHIDLRYATKDNFTGEVVYPFNRCLVHHDTAACLKKAQAEFASMGLSLKIWDGFRPFSAQSRFWELVPDPRYVSNPKKGGKHTRGIAVDVTLVDSKGKELPMPSAFDEFSEKAHRDYKGGTKEELCSRALLQSVMYKHGFTGYSSEWWHFNLNNWREYPPLETISSEIIAQSEME